MRSSKINYAVVGAFVLVVLAGLVVAISLLTGRTGATDTYYTVYRNVGGLKFGTPVTFEGYRVGQVDSIEPTQGEDGMAFRVELTVEEGFPIPQDSTAAIGSSGLLAGAAVQIEGGQSPQTLEPGERIQPGASADVFAAVSRVAGQINKLSEEGISPLLAKLNRYTDDMGQVLTQRTPQLIDDLKTASEALAETTPRVAADVEAFSSSLNEEVLGPDNLARIEATLANLESASRNLDQEVMGEANRRRVAKTLNNLQEASGQFARLTRELMDTKAQADALIAQMDRMVETTGGELSGSLEDLRYTMSVVSENVDAIAHNLEGASRHMNEFSRQIRQNPGVLLRGTETPEERR